MMLPLVVSVYPKLEKALLYRPGVCSGGCGNGSGVTVTRPVGVCTVCVGRSDGTQIPVPKPVPAPGKNTHKSFIIKGRYGGVTVDWIGRPQPPNIHLRSAESDQVAAKSLPPGVFRSCGGGG